MVASLAQHPRLLPVSLLPSDTGVVVLCYKYDHNGSGLDTSMPIHGPGSEGNQPGCIATPNADSVRLDSPLNEVVGIFSRAFPHLGKTEIQWHGRLGIPVTDYWKPILQNTRCRGTRFSAIGSPSFWEIRAVNFAPSVHALKYVGTSECKTVRGSGMTSCPRKWNTKEP